MLSHLMKMLLLVLIALSKSIDASTGSSSSNTAAGSNGKSPWIWWNSDNNRKINFSLFSFLRERREKEKGKKRFLISQIGNETNLIMFIGYDGCVWYILNE